MVGAGDEAQGRRNPDLITWTLHSLANASHWWIWEASLPGGGATMSR